MAGSVNNPYVVSMVNSVRSADTTSLTADQDQAMYDNPLVVKGNRLIADGVEYWSWKNGDFVMEADGSFRPKREGETGTHELIKNSLPARTQSVPAFKDNRRSDANASGYLACIPIDDDSYKHSPDFRPLSEMTPDEREAYWEKRREIAMGVLAEALKLEGKANSIWRVYQAELSLHGGYHLLINIPAGMTAEEARDEFCRELGITPDLAVKEPSRLMIYPDRKNLLYQSPDRYEIPQMDEWPSGKKGKTASTTVKEEAVKTDKGFPQLYDGYYPYALVVYKLVEVLKEDKKIMVQVEEGHRNDFLLYLSRHLSDICDTVEHLEFLLADNHFGLEEPEATTTIHNGWSYRTGKPSNQLKKALERTARHLLKSDTPPPMPKKKPRLIAHLVSKVPEDYQPSVAIGAFPMLATHVSGVTLKYIDKQLHELLFIVLQMGKTASGKSCINGVKDRILASIHESDARAWAIVENWKAEMRRLGGNDKKPDEPTPPIQVLLTNTTTACFNKRGRNANGKPLYISVNEVEELKKLTGNSAEQLFIMLRLAQDHNATWGQDRAGVESVTAQFPLRLNINMTATTGLAIKFLRNELTTGTVNRMLMVATKDQEIGAKIPVYKEYDDKFDAVLKPYLDNLSKAKGLFNVPVVRKLAEELNDWAADEAVRLGIEAFDEFRKRSTLNVVKAAYLLYIANGCVWEKSIGTFCRWMLEYDLWCKMRFFGDATQRAIEKGDAAIKRGPVSALDFLGEEFTYEELCRVCKDIGFKKPVNKLLSNYKSKGYVEPIEDSNDNCWRKTADYLQKHPQEPLAA